MNIYTAGVYNYTLCKLPRVPGKNLCKLPIDKLAGKMV